MMMSPPSSANYFCKSCSTFGGVCGGGGVGNLIPVFLKYHGLCTYYCTTRCSSNDSTAVSIPTLGLPKNKIQCPFLNLKKIGIEVFSFSVSFLWKAHLKFIHSHILKKPVISWLLKDKAERQGERTTDSESGS